jgi:hypothetical protein
MYQFVIAVFQVTGKLQRHLHNACVNGKSQTALVQIPGL